MGQEFRWKLLQGRNRKWHLEIHGTCLIFDIIRLSLSLPLVRTGNDGWVPFLECQLTWVHATFLWYSQVSAIASPCGSVWLYMRPIIDHLLYTEKIVLNYGRHLAQQNSVMVYSSVAVAFTSTPEYSTLLLLHFPHPHMTCGKRLHWVVTLAYPGSTLLPAVELA